jgi:hypothetical protein
VVLPARCVSSVSPRFHLRRHTFCFLPLVNLGISSPLVNSLEALDHDLKKCDTMAIWTTYLQGIFLGIPMIMQEVGIRKLRSTE